MERNFENLRVWQEARVFVNDIYDMMHLGIVGYRLPRTRLGSAHASMAEQIRVFWVFVKDFCDFRDFCMTINQRTWEKVQMHNKSAFGALFFVFVCSSGFYFVFLHRIADFRFLLMIKYYDLDTRIYENLVRQDIELVLLEKITALLVCPDS